MVDNLFVGSLHVSMYYKGFLDSKYSEKFISFNAICIVIFYSFYPIETTITPCTSTKNRQVDFVNFIK